MSERHNTVAYWREQARVLRERAEKAEAERDANQQDFEMMLANRNQLSDTIEEMRHNFDGNLTAMGHPPHPKCKFRRLLETDQWIPSQGTKPPGWSTQEADLLTRGEAARRDENGNLPPGATHEIVDDPHSDKPKIVRRRYSIVGPAQEVDGGDELVTRHDLTCSYDDCVAPPGSEDHQLEDDRD